MPAVRRPDGSLVGSQGSAGFGGVLQGTYNPQNNVAGANVVQNAADGGVVQDTYNPQNDAVGAALFQVQSAAAARAAAQAAAAAAAARRRNNILGFLKDSGLWKNLSLKKSPITAPPLELKSLLENFNLRVADKPPPTGYSALVNANSGASEKVLSDLGLGLDDGLLTPYLERQTRGKINFNQGAGDAINNPGGLNMSGQGIPLDNTEQFGPFKEDSVQGPGIRPEEVAVLEREKLDKQLAQQYREGISQGKSQEDSANYAFEQMKGQLPEQRYNDYVNSMADNSIARDQKYAEMQAQEQQKHQYDGVKGIAKLVGEIGLGSLKNPPKFAYESVIKPTAEMGYNVGLGALEGLTSAVVAATGDLGTAQAIQQRRAYQGLNKMLGFAGIQEGKPLKGAAALLNTTLQGVLTGAGAGGAAKAGVSGGINAARGTVNAARADLPNALGQAAVRSAQAGGVGAALGAPMGALGAAANDQNILQGAAQGAASGLAFAPLGALGLTPKRPGIGQEVNLLRNPIPETPAQKLLPPGEKGSPLALPEGKPSVPGRYDQALMKYIFDGKQPQGRPMTVTPDGRVIPSAAVDTAIERTLGSMREPDEAGLVPVGRPQTKGIVQTPDGPVRFNIIDERAAIESRKAAFRESRGTAEEPTGAKPAEKPVTIENHNPLTQPFVSLKDWKAQVGNLVAGLKGDSGASGKQLDFAFEKAAGGQNKFYRFIQSGLQNPARQADQRSAVELAATNKELNRVSGNMKAGTPESAAVQQFAEGKTSHSDLVQSFGVEKTKTIEETAKFQRDWYDSIIIRIQDAQKAAGVKEKDIIKKRQDYMRHIQEISRARGETGPQNVAEVSVKTSISEARKGDTAVDDAIGGFMDYGPQAMREVYGRDVTARLTALESALRGAGKTKLANAVRDSSRRVSGDLSTTPGSRTAKFNEALDQTKVVQGLSKLRSRVGGNLVIGNLRVSLIQPAQAMLESIRRVGPVGTARSIVENIAKGNLDDSPAIIARSTDPMAGMGTRVEGAKQKLVKASLLKPDQLGLSILERGLRRKAEKAGFTPEAAKYEASRRSMGGIGDRGDLNMPTFFSGKTSGILGHLTYEPTNQLYRIFKQAGFDPIYDKNPGTAALRQMKDLAYLYTASYAFNQGFQGATGNKVFSDPVQTTLDMHDDIKKGKLLEAAGRLTGEVGSQIPLVGTAVGAVLGEKNTKKYFGKTQIGYYGIGIPALAPADTIRKGAKDIHSALKYEKPGNIPTILKNAGLTLASQLASPIGGGSQVKKTLSGLASLGHPYQSASGNELPFTPAVNLPNVLKAALFGKSATGESQKFFDEAENLGAFPPNPKKIEGIKGSLGIIEAMRKQGLAGKGPSLSDGEIGLLSRFADDNGDVVSNKKSRDNIINSLPKDQREQARLTLERYDLTRASVTEYAGKLADQKKNQNSGKTNIAEDWENDQKVNNTKADANFSPEIQTFNGWGSQQQENYLRDIREGKIPRYLPDGTDRLDSLTTLYQQLKTARSDAGGTPQTDVGRFTTTEAAQKLLINSTQSSNLVDFAGLSDPQQRKYFNFNPGYQDPKQSSYPADAYQQMLINAGLTTPYTKTNQTYDPNKPIYSGKGTNRAGMDPLAFLGGGTGIKQSGGSSGGSGGRSGGKRGGRKGPRPKARNPRKAKKVSMTTKSYKKPTYKKSRKSSTSSLLASYGIL